MWTQGTAPDRVPGRAETSVDIILKRAPNTSEQRRNARAPHNIHTAILSVDARATQGRKRTPQSRYQQLFPATVPRTDPSHSTLTQLHQPVLLGVALRCMLTRYPCQCCLTRNCFCDSQRQCSELVDRSAGRMSWAATPPGGTASSPSNHSLAHHPPLPRLDLREQHACAQAYDDGGQVLGVGGLRERQQPHHRHGDLVQRPDQTADRVNKHMKSCCQCLLLTLCLANFMRFWRRQSQAA